MADLSKIKLNGIEYNLKDAEARQLVSDLEDSMPEVPSALSELDNDVGYITSYTETDPTVPAWAKAENKPSYTANEVGALPSSTTYVSSVNGSSGAVTINLPTYYGNNEPSFGYPLLMPNLPLSGTLLGNQGHTSKALSLNTDGTLQIGLQHSEEGSQGKISLSNASTNNKGYTQIKPSATTNIILTLPSTTGTLGLENKLKTIASTNNTEYNLIGTETSNANTAAVDIYKQDLLSFAKTSSLARLTIGSTSMPGVVRVYTSANSANGFTDIKSNASSTNERTIILPDASGTVALTTDIPNVPSWALASSKPSYTFSELTSHPTTLNDYGITNAYTKTEVDGLVSGVLHYKGTKATVSALPSNDNVTGDVWHITADGSEWAWDGSDWQELGTTIDLTGYLQSSDIAAWAKASNKPSYTASEVGALANNTTYVSTFNGQSGAITYIAPVTSVNGQTGAVTLSIPTTASDISAASATHAHGNITSGGDMTATAAIASGDRLVINDESASKLTSSTITFGSSTAQYLANNGTWQNVPATYDDTALAARVTALEQIPWVTYYTGSSTPSNSQGNNGDLYFQTAQ